MIILFSWFLGSLLAAADKRRLNKVSKTPCEGFR